ncbi:hypothetical protein BH20ACI2_BH20ACI2_18550 [soil metagenome]
MQARWLRAVVKNMAKVRITSGAFHLGPFFGLYTPVYRFNEILFISRAAYRQNAPEAKRSISAMVLNDLVKALSE